MKTSFFPKRFDLPFVPHQWLYLNYFGISPDPAGAFSCPAEGGISHGREVPGDHRFLWKRTCDLPKRKQAEASGHVTATAEFLRDMGYGTTVFLDGKPAYDGLFYLYTGEPITPEVSVYDNIRDTWLTDGTDYTVSFADNVGTEDEEVTEAAVTVSGIGDYYGTKTEPFSIASYRDISVCTVNHPTVYDDGYGPYYSLEQRLVVIYGDTRLEPGMDYNVDLAGKTRGRFFCPGSSRDKRTVPLSAIVTGI